MGCSSTSTIDDDAKNKKKNEIKEKEVNEGKEEDKGKKENEGKEEQILSKEKNIGEIVNLQYAKKDPGFVPDELIDILRESVVRIEIKNLHIISSGFFIKINLKMKEYKFLFTCAHSIPQEIIDSKTKISIYYGRKNEEIKKKIILDKDQRYIMQNKDLDVTIIEIKEEDNIYENRFLHPDLNYKIGLKHYLNSQVYTAGYPNVDIHKGDKHYSSGIIKQISNNGYTFTHNCDTKEGSSGGPIINYDKLVIGIHFGSIEEKNINVGTFIGEIIKELFLEEKNINPLIEEDDKEDEKEKKNSNLGFLELGLSMMNQMMENESFVNFTKEFAKNINLEEFCSNILNQPQLKQLNPTPEEMEKLKDKNNKYDQEALFKFNLQKMGCNKNEQEILTKNYKEFLDNPNYKKFQNDIKIQNNI
jgi:V8-like Glu-specific endopeptidase